MQSASSDGPQILVVDDDAEVSAVVRRLLVELEKARPFRADVTCALSARQALEFANKRKFDIFVVDLKLPDRESDRDPRAAVGRRLLSLLIQKPNSGIIVYSSEPKDRKAGEYLLLGADDFIQKTDGSEFLVEKIYALWRRVKSKQ